MSAKVRAAVGERGAYPPGWRSPALAPVWSAPRRRRRRPSRSAAARDAVGVTAVPVGNDGRASTSKTGKVSAS